MSTLLTKRGRDRIPKNVSGDSALAFGGTITQINGMTIHTFTANGQFVCKNLEQVKYLVVGAGGPGGGNGRGGGGGGQVLQGDLAVADGIFQITIGQGGAWNSDNEEAPTAAKSIFSTVEALGGRSGGDPAGGTDYADGGAYQSGTGGAGTNGDSSSISGSATVYGGGGGGAGTTGSGAGGNGGGGTGGRTGVNPTVGAANSGGGGGGGQIGAFGALGGSGIVIISYPTP